MSGKSKVTEASRISFGRAGAAMGRATDPKPKPLYMGKGVGVDWIATTALANDLLPRIRCGDCAAMLYTQWDRHRYIDGRLVLHSQVKCECGAMVHGFFAVPTVL